MKEVEEIALKSVAESPELESRSARVTVTTPQQTATVSSEAVIVGQQQESPAADSVVLPTVQQPGMDNFPDELLQAVFEFLEFSDLRNAAQVDKHWRSIIMGDLPRYIRGILQKEGYQYSVASRLLSAVQENSRLSSVILAEAFRHSKAILQSLPRKTDDVCDQQIRGMIDDTLLVKAEKAAGALTALFLQADKTDNSPVKKFCLDIINHQYSYEVLHSCIKAQNFMVFLKFLAAGIKLNAENQAARSLLECTMEVSYLTKLLQHSAERRQFSKQQLDRGLYYYLQQHRLPCRDIINVYLQCGATLFADMGNGNSSFCHLVLLQADSTFSQYWLSDIGRRISEHDFFPLQFAGATTPTSSSSQRSTYFDAADLKSFIPAAPHSEQVQKALDFTLLALSRKKTSLFPLQKQPMTMVAEWIAAGVQCLSCEQLIANLCSSVAGRQIDKRILQHCLRSEAVLAMPDEGAKLLRTAEMFFHFEVTQALLAANSQLILQAPRGTLYKFFAKIAGIEEFLQALELLRLQASDLQRRQQSQAAVATWQLIEQLLLAAYTQLYRENDIAAFKQACQQAIETVKPLLQQHRNSNYVAANVALAIGSLGVGYATAAAFNRYRNGHYSFFTKTASSSKLEVLEQAVGALRMRIGTEEAGLYGGCILFEQGFALNRTNLQFLILRMKRERQSITRSNKLALLRAYAEIRVQDREQFSGDWSRSVQSSTLLPLRAHALSHAYSREAKLEACLRAIMAINQGDKPERNAANRQGLLASIIDLPLSVEPSFVVSTAKVGKK